MIDIIIVDDHQIVIDGLRSLLADVEGFRIVDTTNHPEQALALIEQHEPHILLTDVVMPEITGLQLAKMVRHRFPNIKILALSMSGQGNVVDEMINDADINGYVLKNIGKAELEKAIRKIAAGGIYFGEEVLVELEKTDHIKKENEENALTQREIEIVRLIEKEMSNKAIADHLFISERTVETHRKNIFRKTKTNSLIGLVKYAYEHRLI
jgi:two-component system, NarL family, nitrate/nitrite response regulator NarL